MSDPIPRRILMTADTIGGVWTYALELIAALDRYGIDVVLATMGAPLTRAQAAELARVHNATLEESRFRLEWMPDAWADVDRAGEWLLTLTARHRPALVHLNGYAHAALPWRVPVLVVAHSCVLSWYDAVKHHPAPSEWDEYRRRVRRGLRAAAAVVTPSRTMRDALVRHYGPVAHGWVIPNGRSTAAHAVSVKEPFILSAGRLWDEGKNIAVLDRIARRVPWPMRVAGAPQHPAGHGAALQHVQPLGNLPAAALDIWYARAAVYALPARYEPFGLSVLEAALAGCALALGDIPSLREIWGDAALWAQPDDADAWCAILGALVADPARRATMGERARARARRYTPVRMAEAYAAAYGALCARPETIGGSLSCAS
jgi:glycogen(starch) synthase